jgi:BMFP domain-containing protein YqiC
MADQLAASSSVDLTGEIEALKKELTEAKRLEKAAWDDWDAKREEFESYRQEAQDSGRLLDKAYERIKELEAKAKETVPLADAIALETALILKRDAVYRERNACVASMAIMATALGWPCGLGIDNRNAEVWDDNWDDEWRNVVYIEVPVAGEFRQLSWHIHDSEVALFANLSKYQRMWDGHTVEQKYEIIAEFCKEAPGRGSGQTNSGKTS